MLYFTRVYLFSTRYTDQINLKVHVGLTHEKLVDIGQKVFVLVF